MTDIGSIVKHNPGNRESFFGFFSGRLGGPEHKRKVGAETESQYLSR